MAEGVITGTIPKTICDRLFLGLPPSERAELQTRLQTHLLASSNPDHPSTRVLLEFVHPKADELSPGQVHDSIISYEHMPRMTHRSQAFKVQEGRWHPTCSPEGGKDGQVDPVLGRKYMEDLKHYALSNPATEIPKLIRRSTEQIQTLRQIFDVLDDAETHSDAVEKGRS